MASAPERFLTRPFVTGGFEYDVETATEADRDLVEALFGDVPPPSGPGGARTTFQLLRGDDAGTSWSVSGQRLERVVLPFLTTALHLLVGEINLGALDSEPDDLHLHAGLVVRDGRSVVIAADGDTGKTTAVAGLLQRGWSYVTDETVRLSRDTESVTGFRKPMSVKPGGGAFVPQLVPWMIPGLDVAPDDFHFVAAGRTGADVAEGGAPHLVVLLERPTDAPRDRAASTALHPADAVVALMQQTLDAERFGAAVPRLARLAARTRCHRLVRGAPGETAAEIERLASAAPVTPVDVSVLPASEAFAPGVVSVALDGRMVVHDPTTGNVFALDAGGARVWRQLGGWGDGDPVDVSGPVLAPFVAELAALGVLAGAR